MTTVVAIIPTTPELLDIEEQSLEALVRALHVGAPPDWPPEFGDERYRRWQRGLLSAHPDDPGYAGYYLIGNGELVGTCGFKGPPGDAGGDRLFGDCVAPPPWLRVRRCGLAG